MDLHYRFGKVNPDFTKLFQKKAPEIFAFQLSGAILSNIIIQDASVAQLVEHHVANVIVAGSTPVTRSIFLP